MPYFSSMGCCAHTLRIDLRGDVSEIKFL